MASIKIASLFLKTLAKPLANKLKSQAKEHEGFRLTTIHIAQVRSGRARVQAKGASKADPGGKCSSCTATR